MINGFYAYTLIKPDRRKTCQETHLLDRGYCGHEHLPLLGLINMNARIYDPLLGRFISPDNYVQSATTISAFNCYAYCRNNPVMFNDPSGNESQEAVYFRNAYNQMINNSYLDHSDYANFSSRGILTQLGLGFDYDFNAMLNLVYQITSGTVGGGGGSRGTGTGTGKSGGSATAGSAGSGGGSPEGQKGQDVIENNSSQPVLEKGPTTSGVQTDFHGATITTKTGGEVFSTPGLSMKWNAMSVFIEGDNSFEYIFDAKTWNVESFTNTTPIGNFSVGMDGSVSFGNSIISVGIASNGDYTLDLSIPFINNSSYGTTLYYNPQIGKNNLNMIMNNVYQFMHKVPPYALSPVMLRLILFY